jgi:hypothetical protein
MGGGGYLEVGKDQDARIKGQGAISDRQLPGSSRWCAAVSVPRTLVDIGGW